MSKQKWFKVLDERQTKTQFPLFHHVAFLKKKMPGALAFFL